MFEKIRAREEAIAHENYMKKQLDEKDKQLDEKDALIAKLLREIEDLRRNP